MGVDLTLFVMDERTTPWSVVKRVELVRHYADFDVLQKEMQPVSEEAIPRDHPELGSGRDGYGELTYRLVCDLPELRGDGPNGSPSNAAVVTHIRAQSRPNQPVIMFGH